MKDFAAEQLDLSLLATPSLVDTAYEPILAARLASLKARMLAAGVDFDVEMLETDPAVILQQEDAYREMLDLQAINDMARARTLGFARGADLDWLAATLYADVPSIARMAGEGDDRYTRRILAAGEALSGAITEGGIVYHALTYDIRVKDAVAFSPRPGANVCVLLIADGAPAEEIRAGVFARLRAPRLRGSEELSVQLARKIEARIAVTLRHGEGPDPAILRAAAVAALETVKARVESRIGAALTTDEVIAAGRVGNVTKLILRAPMADVIPGREAVLKITGINVLTEVVR